MEEKFSRLIFIPIAAVLCFMIGYQYVCPAESNTCYFRREESRLFEQYPSILHTGEQPEEDLAAKTPFRFNFTERDLDRHVDFDIRGDDVMAFLHIQKTGGTTFGRHLVKNIQLEQPCECTPGQRKCTCHRPGKSESWLFSRFSTGWSCGLHADWTELTSCVPVVMNKRDKKSSRKRKRNFYYITMLRDPVSRYLSEWKHVQRGATWKTALHMCDGRPATEDELPACYSGEDWTGVTLADFMNCPSNLANNRQVRMLADLSLVGCYNMSSMNELERGRVLLASAKANLLNMAFYGLTEYQRKTQHLFERTFNLRFIRPFTQINSTRAASVGIDKKAQWRIEGLNALDMELYEYAKELFLRRYQYNRQKQHQEERLRRRQERQRLHRTYLAELLRLGGGEDEMEDMKFLTTTEDYNSQVVRW
ncbi:heparan-sulfate 6-O-sulfotransferase 3-B-like [Corythoichthys intestinalis]|uniref:heparan-sulfate 6-O-sulfotransferase 3-B-like n=1 Tax=Corythoichthys intestinalis TaxID=161448 RepID=UPI0025A582CB|nr:heparan-sulfate 6-O-sulfotransferase 3-B-like [Corythoichthys intestinalis]XP_061803223.1 heparan-sulfate 6-O-sulfotransferase 3-B-like [Nerophis lumbriciformis]